jgi:hypothetical protein
VNDDLLPALQNAERVVRADLLRQYYESAPLMEKARARLRAEESSVAAADRDPWLVTFAGRAATVYVLKSLYVRVLEDQGLLAPERIRDGGTYPLFAELFPNLGLDAYLRTVFDDARRVLPELFALTPVEIAEPSATAARIVWDVWQERRATGEPFAFGGAELDTRFIGDLYQDLDPQVKDRYALLQTPRFVESFILDRTLTPAREQFGLQDLRLLDPTCGSGHFLLGAFERLARWWRAELGDANNPHVRWEAALRALASVCGVDLNDYATALTRFRLLLAVVRETGVRDTARLRDLHFDVITCDALIPWESLSEQPLLDGSRDPRSIRQYGPDDERDRNVAFFARPFHAVVGNPPYKAVADREKREKYHELWPNSACGRYSLSAPMAERFMLLPIDGGRSGFITSNNFCKRDFGRGLITKVFTRIRLDAVIDTSGTYLPGHGTPTVILFATKALPRRDNAVHVVSGKRGEIGVPADPARGLVWSTIVEHAENVGYEDRWISVSKVPQTKLCIHPWSFGSDAVTAIKAKLDAFPRLRELGAEAGPAVIIIEDDAFFRRYSRGLPLRRVVDGVDVRDWEIGPGPEHVLMPYDYEDRIVLEQSALNDLWQLRTTLRNRGTFGTTFEALGLPWHSYRQYIINRLKAGEPRIVISEIGTNSHFVYDASDAVCTQTAPVLVLRDGGAKLYKDVAAVLNSSTLEFWFKQVCFPKGGDIVGEGRVPGEPWDRYYVRNGTNVIQAPYDRSSLETRRDVIAQIESVLASRQLNDPRRLVIETVAEDVTPALLSAQIADEHDLARLVFLQEELDWLCYQTFGLADDVPILGVDEPRVLRRGDRPFEIALARRVTRGEEQTKWFDRHDLTMVTSIPEDYDDAHRSVLEARLARIEGDETLAILEQPVFKRRWSQTPWNERVRSAATTFLADALETIVREAGPTRPLVLGDFVAYVRRDPKMVGIAALLAADAGRLAEILQTVLDANAVPDAPSRLFKPSGLEKLAADALAGAPDVSEPFPPGSATNWKRVWRLQEREDHGETIDPMSVAPPFKRLDYAHANGWNLRGKFNVPNERFIVYEDVAPKRYGWGGWTTAERARASLEIFQLRNYENDGAPERPADDPSRCPIQFALWDKLDELRRIADPIEPAVRSIAEICEARCPCPILDVWRSTPVVKKTNGKAAGKGSDKAKADSEPVLSAGLPESSHDVPLDPNVVLGVHAIIREAGERGRSTADLLVAASGDETLLRRIIGALRARGEIDVIGKGRGTRYVDPREVERLAAAELPLL